MALSERRLAALTEQVGRELGRSCDRGCLDRLARLIYVELGYRREVEDLRLQPSLLPWVLDQRRGSCLGLGSLYLVIGEAVGLPLEGVLVPGHFFLRYHGPDGWRGIELLKEGREMPESWYRERYRPPAGNPLYLRTLRAEETVAVLRFNFANALRERGALARAVEEYRRVIELLPEFAEAQANLGLAFHQLRDFPHAEQAYLRARQAHPGLAGLQNNLDKLYRDWGHNREAGSRDGSTGR